MILPQIDSALLEYKAYAYQHKHFVNQTELDAIEELHRHKIFAEPGRGTRFKYADVVAWGCVLIEVRTAKINLATNSYTWHVRARRTKEDVIRGHLVMLVCIDADNSKSHHLFPSNHPCFFIDGKMKKGTKYTPGATQNKRTLKSNPLTDEIMSAHKNTWHLVEYCKNQIGETYSIEGYRQILKAA